MARRGRIREPGQEQVALSFARTSSEPRVPTVEASRPKSGRALQCDHHSNRRLSLRHAVDSEIDSSSNGFVSQLLMRRKPSLRARWIVEPGCISLSGKLSDSQGQKVPGLEPRVTVSLARGNVNYCPAMPLFTKILTSTRRFSARPCAVSLAAVGSAVPIAPGAITWRTGTLQSCIK